MAPGGTRRTAAVPRPRRANDGGRREAATPVRALPLEHISAPQACQVRGSTTRRPFQDLKTFDAIALGDRHALLDTPGTDL